MSGQTLFEQSNQDAEGQEASPAEIFKRVHRLLRGRYPIAVILAILGAAGGAYLGFVSQTPLYQSTGRIQVKPMLGKILEESEMSSVMPMFRNYVNTQAALVKSQRIVERAMQSDEWRSLGRGISPGEQEAFERALTVEVDNRSGELIDVSFLDPDPRAAHVAVREVIRSYRELHAEEERLDDPKRMTVLRDRRQMLQNEIERRKTQMEEIGKEYGTIDLAERHDNDLEYLFELERTQRQLQIELDKAEAREAMGEEDKTIPVTEDMDVAQIATVDPEMAALLQGRRAIEADIDRMRANGIGERHRDMKRAIADLQAMDSQITSYKQQWIAANAGEGLELAIGLGGGDPEQIAAQLDLVTARLEQWRAATVALGEKRRRIEQLQTENTHDAAELARVEDRLDQINLESKVQDLQGVAGRISVVSEGQLPTSPAIDRRVKMAAAGAVVAGGAPVGLIMLLGLLSGRYRYSDETKGQIRSPLLGILPKLPENLTDPEQANVAAHCVHQIRTLLQIGVEGDRSPVFAVTSPTAGDGKTSLALSLGFSFASSGARTLLIDFDMIGGGLSSALRQKDESGVFKALAEGSIDGHVRTMWVDRLSLLPVGRNDADQVGRLSPGAVRTIIDQARSQYDVVVADTGPILGSLEASVLGGEADGVVLVLGRGQSHANAQRAFEQLGAIKARILGVVFNRAKAADVRRSVSSASIRSMPVEATESEALKIGPEQARVLDGLGPMPRTIAASIGRVA